jgi:hypothetical protein
MSITQRGGTPMYTKELNAMPDYDATEKVKDSFMAALKQLTKYGNTAAIALKAHGALFDNDTAKLNYNKVYGMIVAINIFTGRKLTLRPTNKTGSIYEIIENEFEDDEVVLYRFDATKI